MRNERGALLLLLAGCLIFCTPGLGEDLIEDLIEDKITDLAGYNFTYSHGSNSIDQFDESVYIPVYGKNFKTERIYLDLYEEPIISILWISETEDHVTIDVISEMYSRLDSSGGDISSAIWGKIIISGMEWRTVYSPKKNGQGYSYVGMIAYTNNLKTAAITIEENRSDLNLDGFNKTLEKIRFEDSIDANPGLSPAYFF